MSAGAGAPERGLPGPDAGNGFTKRILRLVKSAPEREAIASGQADAVIDPASGNVFLLPDAQRALRQDQARIRSLLALAADSCWEQDEGYRFVSHSVIAAGNPALDAETSIGKPLWELPFDNMGEADWDAHRRQLEWRAAFRDLELRYADRAGEMRWISISGEPTFDEQDRFKGYRGTLRDITLRKQSEALAQLFRDGLAERARGEDIAVRRREERPRRPEHRAAKRSGTANGLLAALPLEDYQRLHAGFETVTLTYGEVLYEPGDAIEHVWFPNDSLVSLLTTVEGRQALEVGLVGREGVVGISLALGMDVASVRALVQGTGTAMRMEAARFREEFAQSPALQRELYRYTHAMLVQVRQTAACNRFHVVEARLARWLLMTRERVRSDQFLLTQEFLADMLGVRRVAVTKAAGTLQQRKLIGYRRGKIRILDRKGLEKASCGCYRVVKDLQAG
jgi:PAS domain S-box-containing protein